MMSTEPHPSTSALIDIGGEHIWGECFRVQFYESEPSGRASAAALCRYFQQAADNQCRSYGLSLAQMRETGRMWVLSRFAMRIHQFPRVGDSVFVETWPAGPEGAFRGYRDFRATTPSGKLFCEAWSVWFVLDVATRRPLRLPRVLLDANWPAYEGDRVDAAKLLAPDQVGEQSNVVVRFSDLDANGHANSACYLEWLLEPLSRKLRDERTLSFLDISFLNEILVGEALVSGVGPSVEAGHTLSFAHALNNNAGQAIAIGSSTWT